MKTSYSQSSTYAACSQHWSYKYVDKIQTKDTGASTFFGSAVDAAVVKMLEDPSSNFYGVFHDMWHESRDFKGKPVTLVDNDEINYAHADYDYDVLNAFAAETVPQILGWMKEAGLQGDNWDEVFKTVAKAKKNPYKRFPDKWLRFFNRVSWLSLYYKGMLLIESFHKQFYPKIDKVLAVQKHGFIKDEETGDSISGYIDMILQLKGHERPIIFDLKTAARPYTEDQIEHSEQLAIYLAMEGQRFNTDTVGYIVLSKAIHKDTVAHCKSCGHKRDGRHRTCNNEVTYTKELSPEDVAAGIIAKSTTGRCGGEWKEDVELTPQVQVLIRKKSDNDINQVLDTQANIILGMKNKVVFKNTSKCENWYGNRCPFFNLCHNGEDPNLIIPPKEEN